MTRGAQIWNITTCSRLWNMLCPVMRVIASGTLRDYGAKHPDAKASLNVWLAKAKAGQWTTMSHVQSAFPKAKSLNGERARFEISGGECRLIVAFDFKHGIAFVKFVGSHAEYDKIDALTVSFF
jgi:mRNA interferase HigB